MVSVVQKGLPVAGVHLRGAFLRGDRVPFIARWPGKIPSGKVDKKSIFSAVDLLPTFCELAGTKLPASYKSDGMSQVQTLMKKGNPEEASHSFGESLHLGQLVSQSLIIG